MAGVGMVAAHAVRRQWRGILVIALLVGVAGAVVLGALAGTRRTSTALDRFDEYSHSADVEIGAGDVTPEQVQAFQRQPGVATVAELYQLGLVVPGSNFLPLAAAVDERFGTVVDRPRVVEGRLPDPSAPHELAIGETLARLLHVRVGGGFTASSYSKAQIDLAAATQSDPGEPAGPRIPLRVVGIVRRPLDLGVRGGPGGVVALTPAFFHRYRDEIGSYAGSVLRVRTERGEADVPKVIAEARRAFGSSPVFSVQGLAIESEGARDAIDVLEVALLVFAGVTAVAGGVAVSVVATRQIASEERDQPTLASLGLTRLERASAAAAVGVPAALLGVFLAALGAAALSPLMPFGVAAKAEIDPGFMIDPLVLGAGSLVILLFVLLVVSAAGWRVSGASSAARDQRARPSLIARAAADAGVAPTVSTGVRMAVEPGRGRDAVPVRSAFVGVVLGILGVVAVLVFSSSLDHLASTPKAFGWTYDALLVPREGIESTPLGTCRSRVPALKQEPELAAVATLCTLSALDVDRRPVTFYALSRMPGWPHSIGPAIVSGRAPRGDAEVALGAATLDALGKHIGDHVRASGAGRTRRFRIVGQAVFAVPSRETDAQLLADGVALTRAGAVRLVGPDAGNDTTVVARFKPGVDPDDLPTAQNGLKRLERGSAVLPTPPVEIAQVQQVDRLPIYLGVLLVVLATVAVAHALVLSVRRRRRDLAVLRTLGFTRPQVRQTILCQSSTHALLGLAAGIPLGLAVGRTVWRSIATSLGVEPRFSISLVALSVVVVGMVVVVNVIGALAARTAVRTTPAAVFRAE